MPKKRDILSKLTNEQLIALAAAYDIELDRSLAKVGLVEALACSHRIKTEGLIELSARISALGDVPSAVFESRQDFFEETAILAFDQIDTIGDTLSVAIAAYEVIEPGYAQKLTNQLNQLRSGKIATMGSAPSHVWSVLSKKQQGAYGIARSLSYQIPKFVETAIVASADTDFAKRHTALQSRPLPPRIAYYIGQSYRCFIAGCYDASIVMLARSLENLLRHRLEKVPVTIDPKATLGQMVGLYRQKIGNDACLEKILEVSNMDRVISAHDVAPYNKEMERRDADHAWTAFEIVVRELPP